MNIEIKFRFYRPSTNKMIYPTTGNFNDLIESEDWKVMQFTGLKDKNGKEIYECDVVIPFSLENKMNKSVVVYEFNQFRIKGTSLYWNFDLEQIEVIGNIFENPELVVSNAVS